MYEVELFHQFSSRILQNVCPDRQTVYIKIRLGSLMLDLHYPLTFGMYFGQKHIFEMALFRF